MLLAPFSPAAHRFFPAPRFLWILPLFLLAGCTGSATRPADDVLGRAWRDAARAVTAGRAFDDALLAARRSDDKGFDRALERLENSGTLNLTPLPAVLVTRRWLDQAQSLNEMGYPLAENGRSMKEFVRAEELTRRSLDYWNKIVEAQPRQSENVKILRFNRALFAHDSLAWALYRQGRYEEALREQNLAVAEAKANAPKGAASKSGLADMLYHLGKIYQALGQTTRARDAFAQGLKLQPNHEKTKQEIDK